MNIYEWLVVRHRCNKSTTLLNLVGKWLAGSC